jgi:hypothetical protein
MCAWPGAISVMFFLWRFGHHGPVQPPLWMIANVPWSSSHLCGCLPVNRINNSIPLSIHRINVSSLCRSDLRTSNVLICWPFSLTCRTKTAPVSDLSAASNRTSGIESRQALLHTINRFIVTKSMTKKGVAHLLLHHGWHSCSMRALPQVQAMTAAELDCCHITHIYVYVYTCIVLQSILGLGQ